MLALSATHALTYMNCQSRIPIDERSASLYRWLFTIAVFVLIFLTSSALSAQLRSVSEFSGDDGSGVYSFASGTPRTLADLMQKPNPVDQRVNIVGHLFLPKSEQKIPAVIMLHGSGGIYDALIDFWPKRLNEANIAVFSIDMFGPRGVKSTGADQSLVPFAADVVDAFSALKLLSTHPRIDTSRITVMGFSRGAVAALRSLSVKINQYQAIDRGGEFNAAILVYAGGCVGGLRPKVNSESFLKKPILFIHGTADDYTPIAPCKDLAERLANAGSPVTFESIPGARHKFDADDQGRHYYQNVVRTLPECPIEVELESLISYDLRTGVRLTRDEYNALDKTCVAYGASVEGSWRARRLALERTINFINSVERSHSGHK